MIVAFIAIVVIMSAFIVIVVINTQILILRCGFSELIPVMLGLSNVVAFMLDAASCFGEGVYGLLFGTSNDFLLSCCPFGIAVWLLLVLLLFGDILWVASWQLIQTHFLSL